ncbi:DUF305 domain-containing protein [Nocardioides dongkuii]|uniref:DUF305 domain-containing protein n=1 Tax=Nocardioides dongkuii TaxID=2760089 RepID=UPI001C706D49|nr:DUF305 domain-containing protein [Nocardioides dongkuii]
MRPSRLAALLLSCVLVLPTGCGGDARTEPPAEHEHLPGEADHTHDAPSSAAPSAAVPEADVPQVQPGGPGEPATTLAPDEVLAPPPWNHDDVSYLQMMIPHHGQALDLTELAETRAADPRVRSLAGRIEAAQGPEIWVMAGWLAERRIDVPSPQEDPHDYDHSEHGHHPMVGLLSDEELAELAAASGTAFDRLFLEGMVRHHRGAVEMADDVLATGIDPRVAEIAADVRVGQGVEIDRMQRILASLR